MSDERPAGIDALKLFMGDDSGAAWHADQSAFDAAFKEFSIRISFGEVWQRPELDVRSRRLITIAMLVALGHTDTLAWHVRAALRHGVSEAEIGELLLHASLYCGIPAALRAFEIARAEVDALRTDATG